MDEEGLDLEEDDQSIMTVKVLKSHFSTPSTESIATIRPARPSPPSSPSPSPSSRSSEEGLKILKGRYYISDPESVTSTPIRSSPILPILPIPPPPPTRIYEPMEIEEGLVAVEYRRNVGTLERVWNWIVGEVLKWIPWGNWW